MKRNVLIFLFVSVALRLSAQLEVIANGNVGIGTTTPSGVGGTTLMLGTSSYGSTFRIKDSGVANADFGLLASTNGTTPLFRFFDFANWADRMVITGAGNVGIGTTTPQATLEVNGTGRFNSTTWFAVDGATLFHTAKDGGATGGIVAEAGKALYLGANNSLATGILINSNGNVGVGTTAPSNELTILQKTDSQTSGGLRVYRANGGSSGVFFQGGDDKTYVFNYGSGFEFYVNGSVRAASISSVGNAWFAGSVQATSFISNTTTYADFVFKPGYQLASLAEVEQHINQHGTLPGVPSEAQVAKEGIDLAAMQVKLLQKIEEITLHQIAQAKDIATLKAENLRLQRQVSALSVQP